MADYPNPFLRGNEIIELAIKEAAAEYLFENSKDKQCRDVERFVRIIHPELANVKAEMQEDGSFVVNATFPTSISYVEIAI